MKCTCSRSPQKQLAGYQSKSMKYTNSNRPSLKIDYTNKLKINTGLEMYY